MRKRLAFRILTAALGFALLAAAGPTDIPHRKAGWWQMTMHLPGGRTMARNLCLDATSDIRNNVMKPGAGCTMNAVKIPGGYSYKKTCGGQTTAGSAIGDFNRAYKITESQGAMHIQTDARWMGACPAGRKADEMWM